MMGFDCMRMFTIMKIQWCVTRKVGGETKRKNWIDVISFLAPF